MAMTPTVTPAADASAFGRDRIHVNAFISRSPPRPRMVNCDPQRAHACDIQSS
jgi:hypothetical protein